MKLLTAVFVLLTANISFAGPGDILGIFSCATVLTENESPEKAPQKEMGPAQTRDVTPVVVADFEKQQAAIALMLEIEALAQGQAIRQASNSVTVSAYGTQIQIHTGRTSKLIQRKERWQVFRQNKWIWDTVVRTYRMNQWNEQRILEVRSMISRGRVSVDAGEQMIRVLEAEIQDNVVMFAKTFGYYSAVSGYLFNTKGRETEKNQEGTTGEAVGALRALGSVAAGTDTTLPTPATAAAAGKKEVSDGVKGAAQWALIELDKSGARFAKSYKARGIDVPEEMPTYQELRDYFYASKDAPEIQKALLEVERDADNRRSFKIFALDDAILAPARWVVHKVMPAHLEAYVLKVFDLGENNAARTAYLFDIFEMLRVEETKQVSELMGRNAPTGGKLLVAMARVFPDLYIEIMGKALAEGKAESEKLGQPVPENQDMTEIPMRKIAGVIKVKDVPLSPRLNFYYQMIEGLQVSNIRGPLPIDSQGDRGQRAAVYVAGAGAFVLGGGTTAYYNWDTIISYSQMFVEKASAFYQWVF